MVAFQNVLAFIGGATIPLSAMIYRQLNPPHTAYQDCLEHLMELDQRAKETWQRSEIPDGTWIKSKTRLTHTALCNMHHGLEIKESARKTWIVEMRQLTRYQCQPVCQLVVKQVVFKYAV
ncbi:hypothetical protein BPOR_0211g00020 [Botrytis porri]|uniref:Uncharacterized protein n=1 Tax=Botrytis porri TaxID=87229 RepID=A0A4Z1KNH7_9HELO|nr:hypothetical protein BPOR_0211g00020 [Botrytis porri]